jgi:anti-sigma factor RsiW
MSWNEHQCEWIRDRIDAYVDGIESDLPAAEHAAIARHASACDACAQEIAFARRVRDELRSLAIPSAPPSVVARAQTQAESPRARVVPLRPRLFARRWIPAVAAAALLVAALWVESDRRRAAHDVAVENAARETALAFSYLNKYARRTGTIVEDDVIERRLLAPVEKAIEKSGVTETKPVAGQS